MIEFLDRTFLWVRSKPFFLRMTLFTRILLAAGFIPTGMVKLLGQRFTLIPIETPIGAFFEAMYQTGLYWRFLGASQVVAGLLLLIPRTAHVGALLFLPIMVNIFVVTVALGFKGTPVVTALMLLAVTYLCAWDFHRWRSIVTDRPWSGATSVPQLRLDPIERIGFIAFAASLLVFFLATRGLAPGSWGIVPMAVGTLAGVVTLLRFLTVGRRLTA
ncbi:MAG: DoxX family membrane protein [bacterium]|nr:DoxX family membrane protein [bacterium]